MLPHSTEWNVGFARVAEQVTQGRQRERSRRVQMHHLREVTGGQQGGSRALGIVGQLATREPRGDDEDVIGAVSFLVALQRVPVNLSVADSAQATRLAITTTA